MPNSTDCFDKHNKKAALKQIILFRYEFFEQATGDSINRFKKQLKQDEKALQELRGYLPDVNEDNHKNISEEEWKLIDEYTDLHMNLSSTKEYLLSLMEMKVVYLFKSLEVIMKRIIQVAYPKTNARDLYNWENMKGFFKSNDIEISDLEGYNECFELLKVNNAIKHNGVINEGIGRINEFIKETEFNYINLEVFCKRVRSKVERFSEVLKEKVEENLFDFSIDRLHRMAKEMRDRMDDVTLNAFIIELQNTLPSNSENLSSNRINSSSDVDDDLPF